MSENNQLAHVPVGDKGVQFDSMDGMIRFAGAVIRSGLAPKGLDRPEQCFIALQMGMEIGMSPMQSLQNIAVINGRPSIYGDAALALAMGTGLVEDFQEKIEHEGDDRVAYCFVKRAGVETPIITTFSVADAKTAGLWGKGGPWKQYPNRMLQMRARGFALRDSFPDALQGLVTVEEAQDYATSPRAAEATPVEAPKIDLNKVKTRGGVDIPAPEPETKPKRKKKAKKADPEPVVSDEAAAVAWANGDEPLTFDEKSDGPIDIEDASDLFDN